MVLIGVQCSLPIPGSFGLLIFYFQTWMTDTARDWLSITAQLC